MCANYPENCLSMFVDHFSKIKANKGLPQIAFSDFDHCQVLTYVVFFKVCCGIDSRWECTSIH